MYLKGTGLEFVKWICLGEGKDKWRPVVNRGEGGLLTA